MQSTATPLDAGMDVAASRQRLQEMGRNVALVGELNWLHGIVNARQLEEVENPAETKLSQVVNGDGSYPYVHPDHPLSLALERMGAAGADALPVVSRANSTARRRRNHDGGCSGCLRSETAGRVEASNMSAAAKLRHEAPPAGLR